MQEPYGRSEKNWVLGVASLASFMMALDALIITTAFAAFQSGIRERCAEPPLAKGATIVGNYRMLEEN